MKTPKFKTKPFLRWAGSKRKIVDKLSTYWTDEYNRYIEPFLGSGSLFFEINPRKAILGDINRELIITYQEIKKNPDKIIRLLKKYKRTKNFYYSIREINPKTLKNHEIAARFIYLNRNCFNGLYRTNLKGLFNVPYAKSRTGHLPSVTDFHNISALLKNAQIKNSDFRQVLNLVKKGDFVYLDPPYAISNRRIFSQYGPNNFGQNDLKDLRNFLKIINKRGAVFVLSYAQSKEASDYFVGWKKRRVRVRRNIAGFSSFRKNAGEYIITNIDRK